MLPLICAALTFGLVFVSVWRLGQPWIRFGSPPQWYGMGHPPEWPKPGVTVNVPIPARYKTSDTGGRLA